MGRTNAAMFSFNRGEVSKQALARVDNERLRLAAECQLNWLPLVVGPMMLRPGLQHINGVLGDAPNAMVPFVFSKFDTALIELTQAVMRVEINDVLLTRPAVSTAIGDPTMTGSGAWTTANTTVGNSVGFGGHMVLQCPVIGGLAQAQQHVTVATADQGVEHGLRVQVQAGPITLRVGTTAGAVDLVAETSLDTGWHSLSFTPGAGFYIQIESTKASPRAVLSVTIDPAGVLEVPTPWNAAALPTIRFDQSGDVIFCAAYGVQQYKIERRGPRPFARSWSVAVFESQNGPFSQPLISDVNLKPDTAFGQALVTADRPVFLPGHVGAMLQMFMLGQQNACQLGGENAFAKPVRVTGVGDVARDYNWFISGTYVGQLTLQRSYDGADSGFTDVATSVSGFTGNINSATGTTGSPVLDNVICWERVGFKGGNFTSGFAAVSSGNASGGGYGLARIDQVNSPTQALVDLVTPLSSVVATNNWAIGDWSSAGGWPSSVSFFEGRLAWSGALTLWDSQPDGFTGYAQQDSQGASLGDGGAIIETFGSGPVDSVNWLLPLTRLLAGRDTSVESIRASSFDEVLTPTNISTKACSTNGAARLKPLKIDKSGVYVSEGGRVYLVQFTAQQMDYSTVDLTRLNSDIYAAGFVDTAVQRQPDTMCWLPRGDGQAAALLFDADDDVVAWWRVQTLGVIENVCVLPAPSGVENFVYLTVRRTINGVTRRFREKFAPRANCTGGSLNQLLDCHGVYQGAPVTTMTLAHLPNTTVGVWADGSYLGTATTNGSGTFTMPDVATVPAGHATVVAGLGGDNRVYSGAATNTMTVPAAYEGYPAEVFAGSQRIGPLVVSGGKITLPNGRTETDLLACFGFSAPYMSAKLAYAAQGGSAINQKKKIDHVGLLMFDAHVKGVTVGQRMDVLDPLPGMESDAAVDPNMLYSEYDEPAFETPGEWDTDARLCMMAMAPYPVKIAGAVISITTNEKL
jgi:hypothetical protein